MDLFILIVLGAFTIGLLIFFTYTSGSNTNCHNCNRPLNWGETKNYSMKLKDGSYKNICKKCDKRLFK